MPDDTFDKAALAARFLVTTPPPPAGVRPDAAARDLRYKAFVLLELGADAYRRDDPFQMPLASWPDEKLRAVEAGCRQLLDWRGFTPDRPLENLGIPGFYALMQTFHFECLQQALAADGPPGLMLDRMSMRHVVTGDETTLFNLVKPPA